jgi:Putative prokaryotic signal transducing protein
MRVAIPDSATLTSQMIKLLTSVGSTAEADMVIALLQDAGIHVMPQRSIGGPEWGMSGARDVWVDEHDLARAREVLKASVGAVSEDELTRLSEQAGREMGQEEER